MNTTLQTLDNALEVLLHLVSFPGAGRVDPASSYVFKEVLHCLTIIRDLLDILNERTPKP